METLLICLLLLYNAWLVTYILFWRKKKNDVSAEERSPAKPPKKEDGIVGKSLFKMKPKETEATIQKPQAAIISEGEVITDIATTFADETSSARLPDDKIDEAFEDIRSSDVPQEYEDDEEQSRGQYATGASFEEIGTALKVADNPTATPQERKQAGRIFSDLEGSSIYNNIIEKNPDRGTRIMGLMDENLKKPISGEGEAVKVSVQPPNKAGVKVPDDISGFDIRDFV